MNWIRQLVARGDIPTSRIGAQHVVTLDDLIIFLAARKANPPRKGRPRIARRKPMFDKGKAGEEKRPEVQSGRLVGESKDE
jgi:hypothetical protein